MLFYIAYSFIRKSLIFSLVNTTTATGKFKRAKHECDISNINVNSNDYEEKLTACVGKILFVGNMAFQPADSF